MKKIVLIPAYQPDHKCIELIGKLSGYPDTEIVIVNDGSGRVYEVVFEMAELYADIISCENNRGKGAALKEGLRYIQKHFEPPYVVVTADADGQHCEEDIRKIAGLAERYPDELILGSRKIQKEVPLRSRFGNTVTRWVFQRVSGERVYDTQTGLRGFTHRSLPRLIQIPGERYEYEMNMLLVWIAEKKKVRENWIHTIYLGDNESSHFDTLKDSYRIYRDILTFSGKRRRERRAKKERLGVGRKYPEFRIFSEINQYEKR